MTAMLHHYSPPEQVDHPHHVTHERPSGEVVTDFHLAGDVLVFRSLADIDGILAALVAAKADHGAAEARHAAEEVMPLDAVQPDMRCADDSSALVDVPRSAPDTTGDGPGGLHEPLVILNAAGYPVGFEGDGITPPPVLPHRQPGVALAEAEAGHPDHGPAYVKLEQDMARLDEAAALEPGETPDA